MNKMELIEAIAERADVSKATAEKTLAATLEAITKALTENDVVSLVGFGSFSARERAARTGRNPATGETLHIEASVVPVFKAGKALKDAVAAAKVAEEA
jgi:DNA-binding protein HU-beta